MKSKIKKDVNKKVSLEPLEALDIFVSTAIEWKTLIWGLFLERNALRSGI